MRDNPRIVTRARTFLGLAVGVLLPLVASGQGANARPDPKSPTAERLPIDEIDQAWPPTLPNDWILGDIRGLFVDERDHLWVIHMPLSLTPQEIGAAVKPPIADCCIPAPPVLELDPEGKVLKAWGGPANFYVDPKTNELFIADGYTNQRVWILRRKDLAILDRFGKPGRQAGACSAGF